MKKRDALKYLYIAALMACLGCGNYVGLGKTDVSAGEGPEITGDGIRFSLYSEDAERVAIAGDFNNWSRTADQLRYNERKGIWEILIPLKPGTYEYKFVIDGKEWIHDPSNQRIADDGFGGYNSVISVGSSE